MVSSSVMNVLPVSSASLLGLFSAAFFIVQTSKRGLLIEPSWLSESTSVDLVSETVGLVPVVLHAAPELPSKSFRGTRGDSDSTTADGDVLIGDGGEVKGENKSDEKCSSNRQMASPPRAFRLDGDETLRMLCL